MNTELHDQGRKITRSLALMTLAHFRAFERLGACRQLIAWGALPRDAHAVLNQLQPDTYPDREVGMQAERKRILQILDRPGAADNPGETLRMIESGQ